MEKYEQLSVVGEGSYGVVLKCRRRDTGQLVAIKKFLETEDDATVRKMALREIRMLKKLRHEHLVNLIEVFRRKKRFYLVLEYLEHTLLDALEASPGGLGERTARAYLYQLLKALAYCHQNSIIHRDVKPENVLVSSAGVLKLCDLGFARSLASPGEPFTEYVATRWYRAPELLVADHKYGAEVDIWAAGCLFAEMMTGEPLFPGDSDIDQLDLIIATVGKLAPRHQQVVVKLSRGGGGAGARGPGGALPGSGAARDLLVACLRTEPRARPTAAALLKHKYFTADGFAESFNAELKRLIERESQATCSASRAPCKPRRHWTLSDVSQESSRPRTGSAAGETLIDYNYTPNAATPLELLPDQTQLRRSSDRLYEVSKAGGETPEGGRSAHGLLPARASIPTLPRTLRDAVQAPPSLKNYQGAACTKKTNKFNYRDAEQLHGRGRNKPHPELSLPYVTGASDTPLIEKKLVKPTKTTIFKVFRKTKKPNIKTLDYWGSSGGSHQLASSRSPTTTNLPFM